MTKLMIAIRNRDGSLNVAPYEEVIQRQSKIRAVARARLASAEAITPTPVLTPPPTPLNAEVKPKRRTPALDSWIHVRGKLKHWKEPELIGLLQDLYNSSAEAQAVIVGRVLIPSAASENHARSSHPATSTASGATSLSKLETQVLRYIWSGRGKGYKANPTFGEPKRIADRYLKATADFGGYVRLRWAVVDRAMMLTIEWGDFGSAFYDGLNAAVDSIIKALPNVDDIALLRAMILRSSQLLVSENMPGFGIDSTINELSIACEQRLAQLL